MGLALMLTGYAQSVSTAPFLINSPCLLDTRFLRVSSYSNLVNNPENTRAFSPK